MATLILRNLFRRKTRTLLTLAGIIVGVALIVALGTVAEVMRTGYMSMFSGSGADLVLMQRGAYDITLSAVDEDVVSQVWALPEVVSATGMTTDIVTTQEIPYLLVRGYDPQGPLASHFRVVSGRGLIGSHDLMLGRPAAYALELNVGDVARLGPAACRVVGIFETGVGWEDACGLVSLQDAQTLFGKPHQVQFLAVKLNDPQQSTAVCDKIIAWFPDLDAAMSAEFAESLPDLQRVKTMAIAISVLAIMVGGIGMMNTMLMSMFEWTREIGTLRSQALAVAIVLGAVGGLYPAWRAANLRPVEALRYE